MTGLSNEPATDKKTALTIVRAVLLDFYQIVEPKAPNQVLFKWLNSYQTRPLL